MSTTKNEIRPIIFEVLEKEVVSRSSKRAAEDRLSELCKSLNASINRRCEEEIDQVRREITFARLILAGLYAEEGSDMRRIAEGYVTGCDASPSRKKK